MSVFVRRLRLTNYKSIAACDVRLGPLALFVGPNGAGKSNFLDSLRFVTDALTVTLEHALRERGGIGNVRRRSRGHPTHFGIRLDLVLPDNRSASYAFRVGAEAEGRFVVQREECRVFSGSALGNGAHFVVEEGRVVESTQSIPSVIERDRLALVVVSALPEFRAVYEGLCGMGFYSLNPERIRDLQDPDPGRLLARDGRNLASVLRELGRAKNGAALDRVNEQLRAVVAGVAGVEHKSLGPKETIAFRVSVHGDPNPWSFYAASMSDGTLRALGVLVAVFQAGGNGGRRIRLVGIEEPEVAIHPGAAEVLAQALVGASEQVQILVTTHSPDLLDHRDFKDDQILAVSTDDGRTVIGPVDAASRSALKDGLYTAGELLRNGQIEPADEALKLEAEQLNLFDPRPDA